jgi:hypothetical protein
MMLPISSALPPPQHSRMAIARAGERYLQMRGGGCENFKTKTKGCENLKTKTKGCENLKTKTKNECGGLTRKKSLLGP